MLNSLVTSVLLGRNSHPYTLVLNTCAHNAFPTMVDTTETVFHKGTEDDFPSGTHQQSTCLRYSLKS